MSKEPTATEGPAADASSELGAGVETVGFGGLTIAYVRDVLRPRRWTVRQSDWCTELLGPLMDRHPDARVLELCAGVGHIGLLTISRLRCPLVMVDVDPTACELAVHNARNAGLADLVEVRAGDMREVLTPAEAFVLVIADPPWVPSHSTQQHAEDPAQAIDGGEDGLDLARRCLDVIAAHLTDDGAAVMQLGEAEQAVRLGDHLSRRPDLRLFLAETRVESGGVLVRLARHRLGT